MAEPVFWVLLLDRRKDRHPFSIHNYVCLSPVISPVSFYVQQSRPLRVALLSVGTLGVLATLRNGNTYVDKLCLRRWHEATNLLQMRECLYTRAVNTHLAILLGYLSIYLSKYDSLKVLETNKLCESSKWIPDDY